MHDKMEVVAVTSHIDSGLPVLCPVIGCRAGRGRHFPKGTTREAFIVAWARISVRESCSATSSGAVLPMEVIKLPGTT